MLSVFIFLKEDTSGHICNKCFPLLTRAYKVNMSQHSEAESSAKTTPYKKEDILPNLTPRVSDRQKTIPSRFLDHPYCLRNPTSTIDSTADDFKAKFSNLFRPKVNCRVETSRVLIQDRLKSIKTPPDVITKSVTKGNYGTGIRHILKRGGRRAQRALRAVLRTTMKKEMKEFLKKYSYPKVNIDSSIENFDWMDLINDMQSTMPTVMECLMGLMPHRYATEKRYLQFKNAYYNFFDTCTFLSVIRPKKINH